MELAARLSHARTQLRRAAVDAGKAAGPRTSASQDRQSQTNWLTECSGCRLPRFSSCCATQLWCGATHAKKAARGVGLVVTIDAMATHRLVILTSSPGNSQPRGCATCHQRRNSAIRSWTTDFSANWREVECTPAAGASRRPVHFVRRTRDRIRVSPRRRGAQLSASAGFRAHKDYCRNGLREG